MAASTKSTWRGFLGSKVMAIGQRLGPDQNGCPEVVVCEERGEG